MKKLLFLGAYLVAFGASPVMAQMHKTGVVNDVVRAQTGGADVVVVKVFEIPGSMRIAVSHGEGKTQVIEAVGGGSKKDIITSSESLHKVITDLYQQGYSLKSTFDGNQGTMSTLVFTKDQ